MRFARPWPRGLRLLLAGQVMSLLGDGVANVALIYAVLDATSSAIDLGIVFAAQWLPLVAFSLLGGVLADRFPRLRAMIGADLARTASQGLLAVLVITGDANLAWFVVLQSVHGAASALFSPAIVGVMPELATGDTLQQWNSIRGIGEAIGNLAGPALAGVLVVLAGPGWALAADAATFAASATCLLAIRASRRRQACEPDVAEDQARAGSAWPDLREGWTQFRSRAWVWSSVISAAIQNLLYSCFFILGPVQAQQHYQGARGWALAIAAPIAAIAGTANVLIAAGAVQLLAGLAPLAVPDVRHLTRQPEPAAPSNGSLRGAESDS